MKNTFKFYEGKEYNKDNKKATKEIINEFKNFQLKVREIMNNSQNVGATDTQSREEIIIYFIKELEKGGLI